MLVCFNLFAKNIDDAYRAYRNRDYINAVRLFEYEIANSPVLKIEYFEVLANSYMRLGDYDNMLKTARLGIVVNRYSSTLHFQRGYSLYKLGDTNEAIEAMEKSLEFNPKSAYIHNFVGLLYLYQTNFNQAEASFIKATVYSPNNIVYLVNLGASYERQKNFIDALNLYKRASKINPSYRGLQNSISRVSAILGLPTTSNSTNASNNSNIDNEIKDAEIEAENRQ